MVHIGTSGFKYPEWKGKFYPEKISPDDMLPFYATHFDTTEINYTFYRMPTTRLLESWREIVPSSFTFSLKAPRRITHDAQLRNCDKLASDFLEICECLGEQFGAALFQLPPTFKKDTALLDQFLIELPKKPRVAFEFRHNSWFDDEVFSTLHSHNAALCIADSEKIRTPVEFTGDFAYFRLRDEGYDARDIEHWNEAISRFHGRTFVYFKHEDKALGPAFAEQLKGMAVPG
jgi:uncharacterized protein YecE (DUF72 family)